VRIYSILWPEEVVVKIIGKHNIIPEEVEQVFSSKPYIRRKGKVLLAYGASMAGRYLFVVFTKINLRQIKIVTAREMTNNERKLYRRKI